MSSLRVIFFLSLILSLSSCSTGMAPDQPVIVPEMEPVPAPSALVDDLPLSTFSDALVWQISALEDRSQTTLTFGRRKISAAKYRDSLIDLLRFVRSKPATVELANFIRDHFDFIAFQDKEGTGHVRATAYFEPVISGSLSPSIRYSQALYSKPRDLVAVKNSTGTIARYRRDDQGKRAGNYFTRAEIDINGALKGRGLELCYVDPLDAFILQTQGSGIIALDNGTELRLNFAEKNGYPYVGLGKLSNGKIPGRVRSLSDLENGLRALPKDELLEILSGNQSYVFFRKGEQNAITAIGVPATPGRTIATDRRYFPKGALAYLVFGRPEFEGSEDSLPAGFRKTSRFVFDQDVGSAILGPNRLDLFIGRGNGAKREAGSINGSARLLYLFPK